MKSIAQKKGKWQPLPHRNIEVFSDGITVPKTGFCFVPDCLTNDQRKERGEITSFSISARRRLRRCMLTESVPDSSRLGATFTVPWKGSNFEPLMDEFRECWNRFGVSFRRRFPRSAMIFRVELQKRGAPHIHALTYLQNDDYFSLSENGALSVLQVAEIEFRDMWSQSVVDLHRGSLHAFLLSGSLVEGIPDTGSMYRYIADHTSKKKQAQLGYKGKQWGKIGGKNLQRAVGECLPDFESEFHAVRFFRLLRKVMRYRVYASRHKTWKRIPVFGSVLRGSKRSVGDFYLSDETARRMWEVSR